METEANVSQMAEKYLNHEVGYKANIALIITKLIISINK